MVASAWLVAVTVPSAALLALLLHFLLRRRIPPQERERRRRLIVNSMGRITDGLITEVQIREGPGAPSHLVYFTYTLNGVTYSAAQDLSALIGRMEGDVSRIAGTASVKYLPGNPSNSIVICEKWSGISGVRVQA